MNSLIVIRRKYKAIYFGNYRKEKQLDTFKTMKT